MANKKVVDELKKRFAKIDNFEEYAVVNDKRIKALAAIIDASNAELEKVIKSITSTATADSIAELKTSSGTKLKSLSDYQTKLNKSVKDAEKYIKRVETSGGESIKTLNEALRQVLDSQIKNDARFDALTDALNTIPAQSGSEIIMPDKPAYTFKVKRTKQGFIDEITATPEIRVLN